VKFLVIGLGSMGKRRIRCLKNLGYNDIVGIDPREDRMKEVVKKYGIEVHKKLSDVSLGKIDVMVISTPPDMHLEYMSRGV